MARDHSPYRAAGLLPAIVVSLGCPWAGAASPSPAEHGGVFVERFDRPPAGRWTVNTAPETKGLWWAGEGEAPGLHFFARSLPGYVTRGTDYAWAEWSIGTRPFEFAAQVEITGGARQAFFHVGACVAVASARPYEMTDKDFALVLTMEESGVGGMVRRGETYKLNPHPRGRDGSFVDEIVSRKLQRGGYPAQTWHKARLGGTRLTLEMRRDADTRVSFAVHNHSLPGRRSGPWWEGSFQLPEDLASIPLRYVAIRRIPVLTVHASPAYGGLFLRGRFTGLQGYALDGSGPPRPEGFQAGEGALGPGAEVTIRGGNFRPGAKVRIGGKDATVLRGDGGQLVVALPELAAGPHRVLVVNPDGLAAELPDALPVGRFLEAVVPWEVPIGGGLVTLRGGGFDGQTEVTVGGRRAEVVKVADPTGMEVRVPAGCPGPQPVRAEADGKPFAGEVPLGFAPHPFLLTTSEGLEDLRRKWDDPRFAAYRRIIERHGETPYALPWMYRLTGERRYLQKLLEQMDAEADTTDHEQFRMMAGVWMAVAYDLAFEDLPPELRVRVEAYLERVAQTYLAATDDGDWWYANKANPSNTVPVGACGGGLAGLALMHCRQSGLAAAERAAATVNQFYTSMAPDGGCIEGTLYWNYGLTHQLILAHALASATGDARGLLDAGPLRNNVHFVEATLGGNARLVPFNDTQPWLTGSAICADFGSRFDQPLMRWLADEMVRRFAADPNDPTHAKENARPYAIVPALLWRDRTPAPGQFPGVPTLAVLKTLQWGVMRSSGDFLPKLVVGVKGQGGLISHHAQQDAGSFVVHADGEAMLIDPGYYQPDAGAHTLPLIDGTGPGLTGAPIAEAWEAGGQRAMAVDATACYRGGKVEDLSGGLGGKQRPFQQKPDGPAPRRFRRLIVLAGDAGAVVLDDILPARDRPGRVESLWQSAWKPQIAEGRTARIRGRRGALALRTFGPELELAAEARQFGRSWIWRRLAEAGQVDWHTLRGSYAADEARPLVAVLTREDAKAAPPEVTCRFEEAGIAVTIGGQPPVRFRRRPGGWQVVRPGDR